MRDMAHDEVIDFLMTGTRTAMVATVRRDGRPHVAPVWFVVIDDHIVFNTGEDTVKGRNLAHDRRVAVSVDDPAPPYSFVLVEATALVAEADAQLVEVATMIGGRYMGAERAEEFGRRNGVPGELVVRVPLEHVVAKADLAA